MLHSMSAMLVVEVNTVPHAMIHEKTIIMCFCYLNLKSFGIVFILALFIKYFYNWYSLMRMRTDYIDLQQIHWPDRYVYWSDFFHLANLSVYWVVIQINWIIRVLWIKTFRCSVYLYSLSLLLILRFFIYVSFLWL